MSPELDAKLCAKYPGIFTDRHAFMRETAMCWGFQCNDGWYNLIDGLCESLANLYLTGINAGTGDCPYIRVNPPQVVATTVKQKLGILRFYYKLVFDPALLKLAKTNVEAHQVISEYSYSIYGIVHHAEILSARTCEFTGQRGELHVSGGSRTGYLMTLNREFARTDPFCVSRGYVPVADLPKEPEGES